jgi:Family of unknown function (DUF5678)
VPGKSGLEKQAQQLPRNVDREGAQKIANSSSGEIEMSEQMRDQVDKNYQAFLSMLPSIIAQHRNKYALIKDRQIIGYYSTLEDVYMTANKFYPNEPYSVQKVTDIPIDLGFFSHAVRVG